MEEHIGIRITNACGNLTHKEIIRKVLQVMRQESIMTCDKWTKIRPRCGECYKCKEGLALP